jgi:outer membrane protein TolC
MPKTKRSARACWLISLVLTGIAMAAGAAEPALLDFDSALQRTLSSNVRVRKAEIAVELAELAQVRARSAFYPRLDLNSSTQRIEAHGNIPGLESLLLSGRSSVYSASTNLRLSMNLFAGGADQAAMQVAEERLREAVLQLAQQRVTLARLLLERFHAVRQAEINLRVADLQRAASAKKVARARAEFDSGRLAQILRDDAQFELQQRELERATRERVLVQARGELQSLMGEGADPVTRMSPDNDYTERLTQRGLTVDSAVSNVDISESLVKQSALEVDRSRSRFLPRIDVYTQMGFAGINESSGATAFKDQRKDKTIIGLTMTWNLFDGFDSLAEHRSNQRRVDSARADVALSIEEQRRQREELKRSLAESQDELQLQEQRLALAKTRLEIGQVKLETGRTDVIGHHLAEIELALQRLDIDRLAETLAYHQARLQLLPRDR